MLEAAPHASSVAFWKGWTYTTDIWRLHRLTRSNAAVPAEVRTVDTATLVKLHSCWKILFH